MQQQNVLSPMLTGNKVSFEKDPYFSKFTSSSSNKLLLTKDLGWYVSDKLTQESCKL